MNKIIKLSLILICFLTSSIVWSETLDDLVQRNKIFYKKFSDEPFSGKVEGRFQGFFENGKKTGLWITYHDNGNLNQKGNYKYGNLDGKWFGYHKNGQLSFNVNFKNGIKDGKYESYYENGNLWNKGSYKNGKENGSWVVYNKDGTLNSKLSGTFKDGNKVN